MAKIPSKGWFMQQNRVWVELKLRKKPELRKLLGDRYPLFERWAIKIYEQYGWQGTDNMVAHFINEDYWDVPKSSFERGKCHDH